MNPSLVSSLGGNEVSVTMQEELEFLIDCYFSSEDSRLPLHLRDIEGKVESLNDNVDDNSLWIGGIPAGISREEFAEEMGKLYGNVEICQFANVTCSANEFRFAVIKVKDSSEDVISLVKKGMDHKINNLPIVVMPRQGAAGGHTYFFKGLTIKVGKKGKKNKRKSIISTPLALKWWKAVYLKRRGKAKLAEVIQRYSIKVKWDDAQQGTMEIFGKGPDIKDGKNAIEELVAELKRATSTVASTDNAYRMRVSNMCRLFEQEFDCAIIINNEMGSPSLNLELIAYDEENLLAELRRRISMEPPALYERSVYVGFKGIDYFYDIKRNNPKRIADLKNKYKLRKFVIEGHKKKVTVQGSKASSVVEAEAEVRAWWVAKQNEEPELHAQEDHPQSPAQEAVFQFDNQQEDIVELVEHHEGDEDLPDNWLPMPQGINDVVVLVDDNSDEALQVLQYMDFKPSIASIERVQNKALWRWFVNECKEANNSQVLWCGTGGTPPEELSYKTEGLSMDCWKKASYCNVFAYSSSNHRQLLLVKAPSSARMMVKNSVMYPAYIVTYY